MNRNVIEAQQIIYHLITLNFSRRGCGKLARAAFYLGAQVWEVAA